MTLARLCLILSLAVAMLAPTLAQTNDKRLFIAPSQDGFEVYIAAAIAKKKVPITVVTNRDKADYTLTASEVEITKIGTGAKFANCIFKNCSGNSDKGTTSVQLVDNDDAVKWSYSVNKGRGQKNKQSLAEAIAKHMKDEFLKR
jgi:hypothetical protein